jgi:hypothetical protein
VFGAIGFLGTVAVVMLTAKGNARLGALVFAVTVVAMVGYAVMQHMGAA